jgi:hypothetical protein
MREESTKKIKIFFKETNKEITCFLKEVGKEKYLVQN